MRRSLRSALLSSLALAVVGVSACTTDRVADSGAASQPATVSPPSGQTYDFGEPRDRDWWGSEGLRPYPGGAMRGEAPNVLVGDIYGDASVTTPTYTYDTFSFGSAQSAPSADGSVRVALLLPTSGPRAKIGQDLLNAGLMAAFEHGDQNFILQPYDTKGTAQGATEAVNLALSQGARLIIGPVFSEAVQAVVPFAQQAGVNVLTFSTDSANARPGVYVMGFQVGQQVDRVVRLARSHGYEELAALVPSNAYGQLVVSSLRQVAAETGGTVTQGRILRPGLGGQFRGGQPSGRLPPAQDQAGRGNGQVRGQGRRRLAAGDGTARTA